MNKEPGKAVTMGSSDSLKPLEPADDTLRGLDSSLALPGGVPIGDTNMADQPTLDVTSLAQDSKRPRNRRGGGKKKDTAVKEGAIGKAEVAKKAKVTAAIRKDALNKNERKAIVGRVANKVNGDDTLLDLLKNSASPEGRTAFLNAVSAIEPGANFIFGLHGVLASYAKAHSLSALGSALRYRANVKALRDGIAKREKARLLAEWEETLSVEEFEKKKLEMKEARQAGQLKFIEAERAAGRVLASKPVASASGYRETKRNQGRHLRKQEAAARRAQALDDLFNDLGGFTLGSGEASEDGVPANASVPSTTVDEGVCLQDD